ncbi:MAG: CBS domain-containing protein [Betaproteobacteria bacterium]|nr:MAG: CBS domain-containing protein [Betaproteobacteria bacterium]
MSESIARLEQRIAEEQQTFARPLRSLLKRSAITCPGELTLEQAAGIMRREEVGSLVVVDAQSRPIGVVTTHDIVQAVALGASARAVAEVMTRSPVSLPGHALAYEAAVAMLAQRIRHVLVVEDGRLVGVVSERDLFSLQRLGFGELAMEIRLAADLGTLARLAAEVRGLTRLLVEQGVGAEQLTMFVSVLNDRVSQRTLEIVRKRHDLERISWCWLAFGSEGRFEQTFSTDQDNGLIFAAHGDSAAGARERLLPFAREVNQALDACGYPLCRGNVMASNPELCLSVDEWKAKMARWIEVSMPKALLDAAVCFDFRGLQGDGSLAATLRAWVAERVRANPRFLRHLAEAALQAQPALGRFGSFDDDGGSIDLKLRGSRIFVDAARVYALSRALQLTNTAERLRAAAPGLGMDAAAVEAIIGGFFFIQRLRLRGQAAPAKPLPPAANRVDLQQINEFERRILKEALRQARRLQQRLALDYELG